MFKRLFALVLVGSLLVAIAPSRMLTCVCTGEQGLAGSNLEIPCEKHAVPKCKRCPPPKAPKGCFISSNTEGAASVTTPVMAIDFGLWFAAPAIVLSTIVHEVEFQPIPQSVEARTREPDVGFHPLRAPPFLA